MRADIGRFTATGIGDSGTVDAIVDTRTERLELNTPRPCGPFAIPRKV